MGAKPKCKREINLRMKTFILLMGWEMIESSVRFDQLDGWKSWNSGNGIPDRFMRWHRQSVSYWNWPLPFDWAVLGLSRTELGLKHSHWLVMMTGSVPVRWDSDTPFAVRTASWVMDEMSQSLVSLQLCWFINPQPTLTVPSNCLVDVMFKFSYVWWWVMMEALNDGIQVQHYKTSLP